MSEIIHLVAQKANESAKKIVLENLSATEYKEIMLKKEKLEKEDKSFFTKIKDWMKGKPEVKDDPPKQAETKPKKSVLPTKKTQKRKGKRASLATRKVKKG
jgi:hypothetical protein